MPETPKDPFETFGEIFDTLFVSKKRQTREPDFLNALGKIISGASDIAAWKSETIVTPTPSPATPEPVKTSEPVFEKSSTEAQDTVLKAKENASTTSAPIDAYSKSIDDAPKTGTVSINGLQYNLLGAGNIVIAGNKVVIDGQIIQIDTTNTDNVLEVKILDGKVANIVSLANISANRVEGNCIAIEDASIGALGGSATVSGDLSCGNIGGSVTVEGDASVSSVGGSISVKGNLQIHSR